MTKTFIFGIIYGLLISSGVGIYLFGYFVSNEILIKIGTINLILAIVFAAILMINLFNDKTIKGKGEPT